MAGSRKVGAITTALVSIASIGVIGGTFMANASPYVDVDQARASHGDNLHLLGDIDKTSIRNNPRTHELIFLLKDAKGRTMEVDYSGEAISNINEATKVVAIGAVENGKFVSHELRIKCPSKYEDAKAPAPSSDARQA